MKTSILKKTPVARNASAKRAAGRFGRPPKELAGEVDDRILDAARKIFIERGFEGATIEERLLNLATVTVHWTLDTERTALMRLAIAEARRFPDLASTVSHTARDLSTEVAARHLGEMTQSDPLGSLPAFAPERLATTARIFLDLVVVPFLLRALFEVNPKMLEAEIDEHVARSVAFFLAACRHGGVS